MDRDDWQGLTRYPDREREVTDDMVEVAARAMHAGSWSDCAFRELHRTQARNALDAVKGMW